MKPFALLLAGAALAVAQSAIQLPRLGCIIDSRDQLRIVYGVRGSFVLSAPIATGVTAFLCSASHIVASSESALIAFDESGTEIARAPITKPVSLHATRNSVIAIETGDTRSFLLKDDQWKEADTPERPSQAEALHLGACSLSLREQTLTFCKTNSLPLPPVLRAEQMGPDWVHAVTAESSYAITVHAGEPQIFLLPTTTRHTDAGHGDAQHGDARHGDPQ